MPERKTSFWSKQNTCHSLLTCKSNIVSQLLQSDDFSFFILNFFWSSSFQSTKCLATTLSSGKCAASDHYMGVYKTWPTPFRLPFGLPLAHSWLTFGLLLAYSWLTAGLPSFHMVHLLPTIPIPVFFCVPNICLLLYAHGQLFPSINWDLVTDG